jgi:hypothetical protein
MNDIISIMLNFFIELDKLQDEIKEMMWFVCEILILIMKILDKIFQEFNFW